MNSIDYLLCSLHKLCVWSTLAVVIYFRFESSTWIGDSLSPSAKYSSKIHKLAKQPFRMSYVYRSSCFFVFSLVPQWATQCALVDFITMSFWMFRIVATDYEFFLRWVPESWASKQSRVQRCKNNYTKLSFTNLRVLLKQGNLELDFILDPSMCRKNILAL